MAAYLVFEISIHDPEGYAAYRSHAGPVLEKFGGRFIARSVANSEGRLETLEGDWEPERFFIVEFPTYEQARTFYYSDAYQEAVQARFSSSTGKAILVDGI